MAEWKNVDKSDWRYRSAKHSRRCDVCLLISMGDAVDVEINLVGRHDLPPKVHVWDAAEELTICARCLRDMLGAATEEA